MAAGDEAPAASPPTLKKIGPNGKVIDSRKTPAPNQPPVDLAKKNAEYANLVKRLMKTIENEKKKNEEKIAALTHESEDRIREVEERCADEKQELEEELQLLLDKQAHAQAEAPANPPRAPAPVAPVLSVRANAPSPVAPVLPSPVPLTSPPQICPLQQPVVLTQGQMPCNNDAFIRNDLQLKLNQLSGELDVKDATLKEVEEERRALKSSNMRLEAIMKEHQQTMLNLRQVLETEVGELRCRLRISEEKNLQLIQRTLGQITTENIYMTPTPPASRYSGQAMIGYHHPGKHMMDPTKTALYELPFAESNLESTRSPGCPLSTKETRTKFCLPFGIPKEYACIMFSVLILGLSFYARTWDNGCGYQTLPYSAPHSNN